MSYQVLARKWRPKRFEDVVGQSHITEALKRAIQTKKIAHAYLLTGTRGVGKTSVARIFAKAIKCEALGVNGNPCQQCKSCKSIDDGSNIDYLEVDGASNNSVDNIRQIVENVQYLPSSGDYKVYVIDEVHMLSVSAFNALLKTLEEPPAHVVFIFATTEPQKLLGTVLSRCQRYDFKNIPFDELKNYISAIAEKESIGFESEYVLDELCRHGDGSLRDTLSLLDQILALSENEIIAESTLLHSLGLAETKALKSVLFNVFKGDSKSLADSFESITSSGVDIKKFVTQLLEQIYFLGIKQRTPLFSNSDIKGLDLSREELLWIYEVMAKDFDWALRSVSPLSAVEVVLNKLALRRQILSHDSLEESLSLEEDTVKKKVITAPVDDAVKREDPLSGPSISTDGVSEEDSKRWKDFVDEVQPLSPTVHLNLERGNLWEGPLFLNNTLKVFLAFKEEDSLFYDSLKESSVKSKLLELIASHFKISPENINFNMTLVPSEAATRVGFKSLVDIDMEREEKTKLDKREELLSNVYIKKAQEIFNSKIDKVIIKE